MADIFDEIQEDLRAERAGRLLKRHGWLGVALVVAVVGAAIGWQQYTAAQNRRDAGAARTYIAAINAIEAGPAGVPKTAEMVTLDKLAATAPEGYRTLARLRAAGLKAGNGDRSGAEALWNAVAADADADHLLREFATLMVAQHELDRASPEFLRSRLKPLAVPDNPWSSLAREQLAALDLRLGKTDEARKAFTALSSDFEAPAGVRARASALLVGLGGAGTS